MSKEHLLQEKVKYCDYLEQIKQRLATIQQFTREEASLSKLGREDYDIEFVALQLRKTLELIAFSSLISNKKVYAKYQKKFASHWNPKKILKYLEKVNPDFYPIPIYLDNINKQGVKHYEIMEDGYLTKEEFVFLYNRCGQILHALNPYGGNKIVKFEKSIDEWVQRILKLLSFFKVSMVDTNEVWIVLLQSTEDNKAHVFASFPVEELEI